MFTAEFAGIGAFQFRTDFANHADVVRGPESILDHQTLAAGLLQHVSQFVRSIGGIDGYENDAGLGGCILADRPFDIIGRPDADPVALGESCRDEGPGEPVHPLRELPVAQADILMHADQGFAVAVLADDPIEE